MTTEIYCGDNLEVMKSFPDGRFDVIYADPPFFTGRDYEVIWKDGAEVRQFGDRWITENPDGTGKGNDPRTECEGRSVSASPRLRYRTTYCSRPPIHRLVMP